MIMLKEITQDNYEQVINLKVLDSQKSFVSSNLYSLAQAWVYKNTAYPFAIYSDSNLIGFVMLGYYELKNQYTLWKFMIDEKYQGKGYGKQSLRLAINWLVDTFNCNEIFTGVSFQNIIADKLYHSLGFIKTGIFDETSNEMKLEIHSKINNCLAEEQLQNIK